MPTTRDIPLYRNFRGLYVWLVETRLFLLWETLTAPPPRRYLLNYELVEREDTLLAALTSARGRIDAPL